MTIPSDVVAWLLNTAWIVSAEPAPSGAVGRSLTSKAVRAGPPAPASVDQAAGDAVPARCIFVIPTGGTSGRGRGEPDSSTVQIAIRSAPYDYDAGLADADAVYEAIHLRPPPDYFEALSFSGRPAHVNQDDQGQNLFVVNVRLRREVAL